MPGQKGQNWAKPRNQPSREDIRCIICGKIFRRNKINSKHFTKVVKVDSENKPVRPGSVAFNGIQNENIKKHTEYFYKNRLDPCSSKICAAVPARIPTQPSPFEDVERRKLLKRKNSTEQESSSEGSSLKKIRKTLNLASNWLVKKCFIDMKFPNYCLVIAENSKLILRSFLNSFWKLNNF